MFKKKSPISIEPETLEAGIAAMDKIEPMRPNPNAPSENPENDWTDHERLTQPKSLHFRNADSDSDSSALWKRLGITVAVLSLVCILAFALAIQFLAPLRSQLMSSTKGLAKASVGTPVAPYVRPALVKFHKFIRGMHLSAKAPALAPGQLTCADRIKAILDQKLKGNVEPGQIYILQSCFMFQDSPQTAIRYSEAPPDAGSGGAKSKQKTALKLNWTTLPLVLLMQEAERRIRIFEKRTPNAFPKCRKWEATPVCMLRFAEEARLPYPSSWEKGYSALEAFVTTQSPHLQAWFHVLASLHAIKGRVAADEFIQKASDALADITDPFLEREIFKARVLNVFNKVDGSPMTETWDRRPFELFAEDEAAFLDVSLVQSLFENPDSAKVHLELFFKNPHSYRFRYDLTWIRFVAEQAILADLSRSGLTWLDKLLLESKKNVNRDTAESILLLRIRLLLGSGKALEAMELISKIERSVSRSLVWHHLRGLATFQAFQKKDRRLLAARELQAAANLEAQSSSPFALIVIFLELGDTTRSEATLAYWSRMKGNDEFLFSLAKGLIQYAKGDLTAARKIWTVQMQREPANEFWAKLSRNLGEDPEFFKKDLFKRLLPMMGPASPLGPLSLFR